ncbi:MAG: response regulator [Devosia sp.]|jgi:DNA-binding response OmpR family regulator
MVDPTAPLSDVRLLIVEDEPLIAIMVEQFAEEMGCASFHTVASVNDGLAAIANFKPQLALVDCSLTHSGPDFTIADALDDASIPFVFSSGHQTNILPVRHRGRDFLAKPFSLELLRTTIIRTRQAALAAARSDTADGAPR